MAESSTSVTRVSGFRTQANWSLRQQAWPAPRGYAVIGMEALYNSPNEGRLRGLIMVFSVEATYENGVLKPAQPLPFEEHEKVRVIVRRAISRVRQTAGLMGWRGSQEDADYVALSPDLDPQEDA